MKSNRPIRPGGCSEQDIPAGAVERTPFRDAALQGPTHAYVEIGMAAADLLEDRYRPDVGRGRKHRHDLALPHSSKRVGRQRPQGLVVCDGNRGSASIR